jgi:hypothetical protein
VGKGKKKTESKDGEARREKSKERKENKTHEVT